MLTLNKFSPEDEMPTPLTSDDLTAEFLLDTAALVQMIKVKNEKGFHVLYDRYSGALYSILIKFVRRTEVAEDLLQDVFLKIWKYIDGYDPARGTLFTWMLNIARNHAIDYLRSSGYKQHAQEVSIDFFSLQVDYMSNNASFVKEVEYKDFKSKVLHLDPKYAEVIDMLFFYGWTHEQTAQQLNLPLGTVKTRARKGLELLKMLCQD